MELEVGDVVLCTVEKVEKTIVFVKIHVNGEKEGSIITSEVAAGRIRNLRDYVVPMKKIVCKVLRITASGNIDLSLRRVNQKEKKEVMEQYQQEKSYESLLKTILGEKAEGIINEIKKESNLYDFFEDAKSDAKKIEKVLGKEAANKIIEILNTQKIKKAVLKKEFKLSTIKPNGLEIIKEILKINKDNEAEIKYISAGRYSVKIISEDLKAADKKISLFLEHVSTHEKRFGAEFSLK